MLRVSPTAPEPEAIAQAAAVLRGGGLVAFPTETVYGLGANARDGAAVARIFSAKGRPANNPLIVHLAAIEQLPVVAREWPEIADRLAKRFWPGPLTLVLKKQPNLPGIVTAGGPTVAVRIPAHSIALALLKATDVPVAAPSANRSERLSPTQAQHVLRDLNGRIDLILDGGPTPGGLESTVLDVTRSPPRLLRPGLVAPAELEAIIGPIDWRLRAAEVEAVPMPSPGMLHRHYAPRAPLECVEHSARTRVEEYTAPGTLVGWLTFDADQQPPAGVRMMAMPGVPAAYASRIYAALHALDDAGVTRIIVELPPSDEEWLAVRDRLLRAADRS